MAEDTKEQVDNISQMIRNLVKVIEEDIHELDDHKINAIESFLHAQVARAMRDARLILARDPGGAETFSFDLAVKPLKIITAGDIKTAPRPVMEARRILPEEISRDPAGTPPIGTPIFDNFGRRVPVFEGRLVKDAEDGEPGAMVPTNIQLALKEGNRKVQSASEPNEDPDGAGFIEEAK